MSSPNRRADEDLTQSAATSWGRCSRAWLVASADGSLYNPRVSDHTSPEHQDRLLYVLIVIVLAGIIVAGLVADGPGGALTGLWRLQAHPARLINDFTLAASPGAALVNAALVAFIGLLLVRINGVRLSGPTVAAVLTMFGFGLFGKTPFNIVPVITGVFVASRFARTQFSEYILIALFGTALAPLVSLLAVELGLPAVVGIPVAALGGLAVGVILPAMARAMLRLHQGYSLYNIGLTTGIIALFAAAVTFGAADQPSGGVLWNADPSPVLVLLTPAVSLVLAITGLIAGGVSSLRSLTRILKLPGRLPSDFMTTESVAGALVNMGLMGGALWGYAMLVGAPINGPVIGGLFTVIGFAAFGKHPRNVWPVLAGVVLAALVFGFDLSSPGVILAALFGTTLAPLVGDFGTIVGVVAGFIHLAIVMRSGSWHAGIGLYNNGLAGGLTATLLVSLIEWYNANWPTRRARRGEASDKETQ